MKWLIVTCDASAHIRPVQEWLFRKYAPQAKLEYIDLGKNAIEKWGPEVAEALVDIKNPLVVFGLDDYLPTGQLLISGFNFAYNLMRHAFPVGPPSKVSGQAYTHYERFELGYGAQNKRPFMRNGEEPFIHKRVSDDLEILEFGRNTPYSVSCQFSIWDTHALKKTLTESTTPWNFETKHRVHAACFNQPVFRWIEESALSGKKWPGKINVNGLPAEDVEELIRLGLLDESKLINRA